MPLARREIFQLFLLMSVVPLQYFLSSQSVLNFTGLNESQVVRGIIQQYNTFVEKVADTKFWKMVKIFWPLKDGTSKDELIEENHLVKEDLDKEENLFAGSQKPRYERYSILYRIGDVVVHKRAGYRAVVVGWDYTIQASDEWKKLFYKGKEELMSEPHYLIAIDTRDRMVPQYGYVAQSSLNTASTGVRVIHPNLENYFESFNGKRFVPRPWLHEIYPRD